MPVYKWKHGENQACSPGADECCKFKEEWVQCFQGIGGGRRGGGQGRGFWSSHVCERRTWLLPALWRSVSACSLQGIMTWKKKNMGEQVDTIWPDSTLVDQLENNLGFICSHHLVVLVFLEKRLALAETWMLSFYEPRQGYVTAGIYLSDGSHNNS